MGLGLGLKWGFGGIRIRFWFWWDLPSHDSSKPPERSADDQLPKRGVYRCPSLSEVKGTEAVASG